MADKKRKATDFLFLSALLGAREARMLTEDRAERMLEAASFEEAAKLLTDCGYEDMSAMEAPEIDAYLAHRRAECLDELQGMCPEKRLIQVFRMKYDYHNAKVLIKAEGANTDGGHLLASAGRIPAGVLKEAYETEAYGDIPGNLASMMPEAKALLARTGNPQLVDFLLDKAYYAEFLDTAEAMGDRFLVGYVRVMIDSANLRAAVRTSRMGKDVDFLKNALIPGGSVGTERILAALGSAELLQSLFAATELEKAAELGAMALTGGTMTQFERACDNAVTEYLKKAKLRAFGSEPIAAYIAAFENEITAVRMILTGQQNGMEPKDVRERLRDIYV